MKHWLLVVSLLLLLPAQGNGQGLSDDRLDLQRIAAADSCFGELVKENIQQAEDTDGDGLLSSATQPLAQRPFAVLVKNSASAAQTEGVTPPIRAPPHYI